MWENEKQLEELELKRCSCKWKIANFNFIKDYETDKCNYRPISLLSVSGKIMESAVASSIMSHISDNNLSNPHQWAYKKDHRTEHMTEDWKRALDNYMVVGIVFVD